MMQKYMTRSLILALTGVAMMGVSGPAMAKTLNAALLNDAGVGVGKAVIRTAPDGVLITVSASGLEPGWHGLHIHAVGKCNDHAAHFKNAGGHLADADEKHGYMNAKGPHKGDLPNIWVHADGTAKVEIYSDDLDAGDLMDADGSAVMIHAAADDYKTDPAGASGQRLACGVIGR